jgi:hypothetical protein
MFVREKLGSKRPPPMATEDPAGRQEDGYQLGGNWEWRS